MGVPYGTLSPFWPVSLTLMRLRTLYQYPWPQVAGEGGSGPALLVATDVVTALVVAAVVVVLEVLAVATVVVAVEVEAVVDVVVEDIVNTVFETVLPHGEEMVAWARELKQGGSAQATTL